MEQLSQALWIPSLVRVQLSPIRDERAVIVGAQAGGEPRIAEAVAVVVRAGIAGVADAVVVEVRLRGIRDKGAVVDGAIVGRIPRIAVAVAVGIGAGVAGIADTVLVCVRLGRIGHVPAVVADVGHPVLVGVGSGDSHTLTRAATVVELQRSPSSRAKMRVVGVHAAGAQAARGVPPAPLDRLTTEAGRRCKRRPEHRFPVAQAFPL